MPEVKLYEDDQRIVWENTTAGWPEVSGSRRELRTEWKPGSEGLTLQQANATASTLEQRARTAIANNRTFLELAAPTNADVVARVKALTRQMNGLIKLTVARDTLADGTLD